jgi:hypothetical protein
VNKKGKRKERESFAGIVVSLFRHLLFKYSGIAKKILNKKRDRA